MTELDLYKFVKDNNLEYHEWAKDEILLFVNYDRITEFRKILDATLFEEDDINCVMKDGYFCFEMTDICEHYGIDHTKIFTFL